jgi:hypothetical protein
MTEGRGYYLVFPVLVVNMRADLTRRAGVTQVNAPDHRAVAALSDER